MYGRTEVDADDEEDDGCWAFLLGVKAAETSEAGSGFDLTSVT